jgi:hypothetical protein
MNVYKLFRGRGKIESICTLLKVSLERFRGIDGAQLGGGIQNNATSAKINFLKYYF